MGQNPRAMFCPSLCSNIVIRGSIEFKGGLLGYYADVFVKARK
jgi:hypothetical protein